MELWKKINKLTGQLEFFVVTTVVFFYILLCYDTLKSSFVAIPVYFLFMSFYYYISCLVKTPGKMLDFNSDDIKGVCKRCNRLVGSKTVHCEICNMCYYKRDHHCTITGKCIAANNFNDLYFTLFFMLLFSSCGIVRDTKYPAFMFVYNYIFVVTSVLLSWMTLLVLTDKTTKELLNNANCIKYDIRPSRLVSLLESGILAVFLPFLKWDIQIIE